MNRRRLLHTALLTAAGVTIPRLAGAAPKLKVTRHRVPWRGLTRGVRVVHFTDVHVGWTTPPEILEAAAEVAHRVEPTFVVLTGDYVNHSLKHVGRLSAFVASLPGPVIATLGNHDHWSGASGVQRALEAGGATVLRNEAVHFVRGDLRLPIVGVDDGRTDNDDVPRAFSKLSAKERALVLTHYPATANEIAEHGAELVLAGHTHGGQVFVPGVTPLIAKMAGHDYLAGWYAVGDGALYVSAGVGASLDGLRGGRAAVPEVAIYDLVPATEATTRATREVSFDGRRFARFTPEDHHYDRVLRAVSDDL
ncbi:metallophosphoesterase [Myxococcota bacterium]|nr:metallophosphoesterase [Myxococcota bacterium]